MKAGRKEKILELIQTYEISTQSELAEKLQESGFEVTQATVSRDIREMKLIKIAKDGGKSSYAVPQRETYPVDERYQKILKQTVQDIRSAENLIVIKTLSGCANAAGEVIDSSNIPEIIGTIAGDDTILMVIDSKEHVAEIEELLRKVVL